MCVCVPFSVACFRLFNGLIYYIFCVRGVCVGRGVGGGGGGGARFKHGSGASAASLQLLTKRTKNTRGKCRWNVESPCRF